MQINFSIAAFDFPGKRSGLSLSCFLFFQICKRFFMTSVGPQILFKSIAKIRKSFVLILYCCHKVYKQKKRFTSCSIILSRINYFINMTLQVVFFQTVKLNSFYNYPVSPFLFYNDVGFPSFFLRLPGGNSPIRFCLIFFFPFFSFSCCILELCSVSLCFQ